MFFVLFGKGIAIGMIIAVPVGPVGILCIRRTIVEGKLAGFLAGVGAATADAIYGVIAGFGLTFISEWLLGYQSWLRVLGGLFLLYAGVSAYCAKPKVGARSQRNPENLAAGFVSTFALTITNPVTILAFLAIFAGFGFSGKQATLGSAAVLVAGVWVGSLLWWLALCLGAGLFRRSFREHHMRLINRGAGSLLVLSGVGLLTTAMLGHHG